MTSAIMDAIPHRPPFLFVDEILELTPLKIRTRFCVSENLDCFKGHYPGNPVFPGVLSLEAVLQTGAILISRASQNRPLSENSFPVVTRINNVKFKNPLKPSDVLDIQVQLKETLDRFSFLEGRIYCRGKLALSLDFAAGWI